jgi:Holliday junction resolvase RusA-like endonuclease
VSQKYLKVPEREIVSLRQDLDNLFKLAVAMQRAKAVLDDKFVNEISKLVYTVECWIDLCEKV